MLSNEFSFLRVMKLTLTIDAGIIDKYSMLDCFSILSEVP
jgi:hypothetical protein